jgi:hypothetical protein
VCIGVPRNRFSVPFSRSVATPAPRVMNDVEATPPAIMPAVKSCGTVTPRPSTSPVKTLPRISSMMIGSEKVKMTVSFSRKKPLSSTEARARPTASTPGGSGSPGPVRSPRLCPLLS